MPELSSQIVAVTVFADRARVTRRGKAAVSPGVQRVEFANLPTTLSTESLRVAARGNVKSKLLGVEARKAFLSEAPAGQVRDVENRLQELEEEDHVRVDRAATLSKQLAHLDGLADATQTFARGLATGTTTVDAQANLLAFIARERNEIQTGLRQVAGERRDLGREIEKTRNELAQIKNFRPRERYTVAVEIEAEAAGELELDLIYVLPRARWTPLYDVRLLDGVLEVTYLGEVTQSTGEDWPDVALTLSTARPATATTLPKLEPWHLSSANTEIMRAMAVPASAPTMKKARLSRAAEALPAEAPVPLLEELEAEASVAQVERRDAAVSFRIAGSVDVPSDNSPRKGTISIFRLPPKFDYLTVPKLAGAFYRRAKFTNSSDCTLLPGRAQLFVGDDYLGSSDLELMVAGQEVRLFFGTDDRLRVERALVQRDVSKKLMSGRRRIHLAYEIRVWNHTDAPQSITVVDQIPVAQHEDIKIVQGEMDPKPTRGDDLNRLFWIFDLAANGKQRIRFDFAIEYPPTMALQGLV